MLGSSKHGSDGGASVEASPATSISNLILFVCESNKELFTSDRREMIRGAEEGRVLVHVVTMRSYLTEFLEPAAVSGYLGSWRTSNQTHGS